MSKENHELTKIIHEFVVIKSSLKPYFLGKALKPIL
jgi:hypothetical protein